MTERRGYTILEVLVSSVVLGLMLGVVTFGVLHLSRSSKRTSETLSQIQEALLLLERMRIELAGVVMNPLAGGVGHRDNSFLISEPYGTSIEYVYETGS